MAEMIGAENSLVSSILIDMGYIREEAVERELIPTARKSQRKGRCAEIELAQLLQEYGYDVKPGRSRSYGAEPDLTGLPGIHVECKRAEQLRVYDWIAQAERDSERFHDGLPAVFHRRNRKGWLVTMRLPDWLEMYQKVTKSTT